MQQTDKVIQITDLLEYHQADGNYKGKIACIRLNPELVNIGTAPAAYMDMFSFFVVKEGSVSFEIDYRRVVMQKGDMLIIYPSLLVRLMEQNPDFVGLHLLCERYLFEHLMTIQPLYQRYALFFRTCFPVIHPSDNSFDELVYTMEHIRHQILHPSAYQEDILLHLLHAFCLQVLELVGAEHNGGASLELNHAETIFRRFIGLLTQHYQKEHQIEFYAGELCMSTTYLSRVVRKLTGKTVNSFISGLLYSEACRLLTYTDKTISLIAEELCFADQSSFGKFFKTHAGISPVKYRAQRKHVS